MPTVERDIAQDHKLFEHMDGDDEPRSGTAAPENLIASGRDENGRAKHRGWPPAGGRRRWLEPFVLMLLADGPTHGYAIIGQLGELGVAEGSVDVGQVYKTLRDLEAAGQVASKWQLEPTGPPRRDYELTGLGRAALAEWKAVMAERKRLIEDFEERVGRSGAAANEETE